MYLPVLILWDIWSLLYPYYIPAYLCLYKKILRKQKRRVQIHLYTTTQFTVYYHENIFAFQRHGEMAQMFAEQHNSLTTVVSDLLLKNKEVLQQRALKCSC